MSDSASLNVTPRIAIPRTELQYRATRAGGPGGQHVNTSSTRVELLWDFATSVAVNDDERARIREKLAARLDADGMVRVVASDRRSQLQNRQSADERLAALIRSALHTPKRRRPTKPTRASKEKRLSDKRRRSERKRDRRSDAE
jgi:ribosome-associated protein